MLAPAEQAFDWGQQVVAVVGYLHQSHSNLTSITGLKKEAQILVSCAVNTLIADILVQTPTDGGVVVAGGEGGGGLAYDVPKKGARKASKLFANVPLLGPGGGGAEIPGGGPAR